MEGGPGFDFETKNQDPASSVPIVAPSALNATTGTAARGLRYMLDSFRRLWCHAVMIVSPVGPGGQVGIAAVQQLADGQVLSTGVSVNSYGFVSIDDGTTPLKYYIAKGIIALGSLSVVNTANTIDLDLRNLHDCASIYITTSGGTFTLVVQVSDDGSNYYTIDSVAAAATQLKVYDISHLGTTIATNALAWRYWKVIVGAAGAGNATFAFISIK